MGLNRRLADLNYLEEDTGVNTRINIYSYQRPRPNAPIVKQPRCFITLPLPDQMPNDNYGMSIQDLDLGLAGNALGLDIGNINDQKMLATIAERLNFKSGSGEGNAAAMGAAVLATAPLISDLLGSKTNITNISDTFQAMAGIVRNPHTALLFRNVQLRTFTFGWRLSPRSEQQSRKLNDIILAVKAAMHPSLAFGGFALDYPDLFKITFNSDKQGIANVDFSFLQDFSINPTPGGHAYYRNGYPVAVDISMTVKEIAIKTSEDFGHPGSGAQSDLYSSGGGASP